jgi:hypothetical protein
MIINDSVSKQELIEEMQSLASIEAKKRQVEEYETEVLIYEAINVIDEIFDSLTYSNKTNKSDDYTYLESWSHRDNSKIEDDWRFLNIDRGRIQESVKIYLEHDWMHNHKTDWLIVNVLNYAEYIATDDFFKQKTLSMNEYLEKKFDYLPVYKNAHIKRKIKKTLTFIGLWVVWFIILIFLNENHYSMPIESYVFIGVTIIIQILLKLKRNKVKDKLNEMLDALSSTYNNCANLNIS